LAIALPGVAQAMPAAEATPATATPWATRATGGLLMVLVASQLDASVADTAQRHRGGDLARAVRAGGDALPFAAFAWAGWQGWLAAPGTPDARTGREAVTAALWAATLAQGTKLAVARARPSSGLGPGHFDRAPRADSSFPSMHSAVTWAVLSRYAEANDAPSLYAAALLTNASRVLGRKHWVSDTVAGSLLGYALANSADRLPLRPGWAAHAPSLQWWLTPRSAGLLMSF